MLRSKTRENLTLAEASTPECLPSHPKTQSKVSVENGSSRREQRVDAQVARSPLVSREPNKPTPTAKLASKPAAPRWALSPRIAAGEEATEHKLEEPEAAGLLGLQDTGI